MSTAIIEHITVVRGARIATVTSPVDGTRAQHGLGTVGEPIRPYLGLRADGYMISLLDAPDVPRIKLVHADRPADSRGKYPFEYVAPDALGAPDYRPFEVAAKEAN